MPKVKVLVRHTFELEEEWEEQYATKSHIEFYYNEGTSCADNILKSILKYKHKIGKEDCLCHIQDSEVLKIGIDDATNKYREARNDEAIEANREEYRINRPT